LLSPTGSPGGVGRSSKTKGIGGQPGLWGGRESTAGGNREDTGKRTAPLGEGETVANRISPNPTVDPGKKSSAGSGLLCEMG